MNSNFNDFCCSDQNQFQPQCQHKCQTNKGTFFGSFKSVIGGVLGFFGGILIISFLSLTFLQRFDKPKYQNLIRFWNNSWNTIEKENQRKDYFDSIKGFNIKKNSEKKENFWNVEEGWKESSEDGWKKE